MLGEDAAVGFGLHFVEVVIEELVVFDQEFAADVDAVDVPLCCDEDEVGVGIFERDAEAFWVDEEEVGELAGFERA